ncbi:MAG: UDP-N-acetylmuramoyl-L-alanine--D-glutamate ligase [Methylococcales bacterium]|nr:UDP-N-acetylmuramoyl-L-alanine--D-glutamate ligase [Methylococcales bacterium]
MDKEAVSESLNNHLSLNSQSKVVVVGLGETGFSVAKFLQQHEIKYAVIDSRDKPPLKDALLKEYPDTPVFTGGFDSAAFEVATHVVVSPGVSLQEYSIRNAIIAGAKLISDIDLFACATNQPVIAVTGSNGKSTVTTMLGEMGNAANVNTAIGGNLGIPALNLLNEAVELYVLELSSFQLERTNVLNAKAATVLNVSEDHLDRHDDIMEYAREKQRVFAGNGVMVLNEDDSIVKSMKTKSRDTLTFSTHKKNGFHIERRQGEDWLMNENQVLMRKSDIPLEGLHNVSNALAALALGSAVGLNPDAMCNALREFKGLDHRMQKVGMVKGVTWVNDSKATNIGACIAALQGYQNKVILIAGGDAKGADMNELISAIKDKAKCVVLMGKDADDIDRAINGCVPAYRAKNIKDAVQIAAKMADEGESVLLSPACASLDQYKSYEERGEQFTAAVMELAA